MAKAKRGPKGMFESKASGQRAWIRHVIGDNAFIRLEPQGSNSVMPYEAFKRQYRRAPTHGNAMTARRAHIIRTSEDRFEQARRGYNAKRYKLGGGYTPEEYKAIARVAGISRAPSNKAKGKLEAYEFKHHPPDSLFAYYDFRKGIVTTWTGDKLGDIVWHGQVVRGFNGGKTKAIRVRGINGLMYAGRCNMTGGDYCRLRRMTGTRTR